MRRFLRRSSIQREPLALTMTGVRMGERVLQIGLGDARLTAQLAVKPGISGHAAIVARDDAEGDRARAIAAESGALVDVHVAPFAALPLADASFDVVVVHAASVLVSGEAAARVAGLAECHRVLRAGGRLISMERGTPTGLAVMLRRAPASDAHAEGGPTATALAAAGFKPVRLLADRDGYRFIEGLKT